MMDGRKCIIYLPNHNKLDLTVQSKHLGKDLWRTIVHKLRLREDDYFGLKYKTTGEHYSWLQHDKRVLDHDIDMKSTVYPLEFIFSVKFFEDSVTVHKHPGTVELVFLQAQNLMYNGEIYVPSALSLELSAYSLQAFHGDFVSDETALSNLKRLSCIPRSVIQEFASLEYCEEQVISWYKNLCGISRGQAVLLYMNKVERLSNYGVHFFKVKDKGKVDWWLGICNKGIYQYRFENKVTPYHVFQWRNLENLHFREKKFFVEVCPGHKRALSTGSTSAVPEKERKAGNNQSTPKTHAWYGSPTLIKSIWTMAIAQHQFYWEKKQSSKSKSHTKQTSASNLRNVLDKNPNSRIVPPTEDTIMQRKANRKNATDSTPKVKRVAPKPPESPEVKAIEEKMIADLKKRKRVLEDRLYDKAQELKEICKEEYNLTERLPIEYLRYMLPDEQRPVLKKKIGAEYRVQLRPHPNRAYKHDLATASELQRLESECELLNQIAKAAYKLAYDPSSKGKMKKKRLQSYQKALKKLQDMENRVNDLREKQGHEAAFRQSTLIMTSDLNIMTALKECSIDEKSDGLSLSSGNMLEDETSISSGTEVHSTHSTPALSQRPYSGSADVDMEDVPVQRSRTPPPTRSTKLAWLQSPMVKTKKRDAQSPNGSYPVLPSPASNRSTTSPSSGTETPPHGGHRERRHKHHDGWKMSSLDSLDSIGSRKSNSASHGSPHKHHTSNGDVMSANARRIARAAKSAQAQKVSLREKHVHSEPSRRMGTVNPVLEIVQDTVPDDGKDSRTSLTDSGVGTDSRIHDEELSKQKKSSHNIRRDISDSSLSELSTQSNPVVSSNIPKFVPYFMSGRNRAATNRSAQSSGSETSKRENEQPPHIRKRSSSFTESASSTLTRPTRDPHKSLNRSKTHNENGNPRTYANDSSHPNGDSPFHQSSADKSSQPVLETSQGGGQLPAPIFDTNLNICKQYLSQSQGQLVQDNSHNNMQVMQPLESTEATSGMQYISVVDKQVDALNPSATQRPMYNVSVNNSNNNKLNFGQIYQLSQAQATQNYARLHPGERSLTPHEVTSLHNVTKSNSLDSVLDRVHPTERHMNPDTSTNYSLQQKFPAQLHPDPNQYPSLFSPTKTHQQRTTVSPSSSSQQGMTWHDRDRYNNEAFQEIQGMSWVPSLAEYGSRASVAESLPAKSKRQDIRDMLNEHFALNKLPRRTPSSTSTTAMRNKKEKQLQAKIRAEMMREKESKNNPEGSQKSESASNTWEDYKQNMTLKKNHIQGAYMQPKKTDHTAVNIFAHNSPPPLPQQSHRNYSTDTASAYSVGTTRKGYVHPNGHVAPDRRPMYPIMYDNNPDYGTIRSNKSSYSAYATTAPPPFERGYLSSTMPRKHGSRENSPQQQVHANPDGHLRSSPQSNFPRTYSNPVGDPNFHPPAPFIRQQHSADSLLTHSFTSPPRSFPAADHRRDNSSNHMAPQQKSHHGKNMQSLHQGQSGYYYQAQQSKMSDNGQKDTKLDESTKTISESGDGALVIQATRTSPDGHKVSVFTVTKSAPSTPLKQEEGEVDGNQFFDADKTITNESDKTLVASPDLVKRSQSETSQISHTDVMQALAIEAARVAQKALISSRGTLDKYTVKAATGSSKSEKTSGSAFRSTQTEWSQNDVKVPPKSNEEPNEPTMEPQDTSTPKRIAVGETKTLRSRSKSGREANVGQSTSPSTPSAAPNRVVIPIRDLRSDAKTSNPSQRTPSPNPATVTFQRTLSTPIRSKPVTLQPNGSPRNNRSTGMYKEPMSGTSARLKPPAPTRVTVSTPTLSRSPAKTTSAMSRQLSTPRPSYQIGQSGTLPRTPKSHKRLERSGSTSGSVYHASRAARLTSAAPNNESGSQKGRSYIPTPRKELYDAFLGIDELKYKRSLSETWKHNNLVPAVNLNLQHHHHHGPVSQHHHHQQIYQRVPQGMDPRASHEIPRRTASADDLLWTPDGRDPNAGRNIRAQQGTLV